MPRLFGTDGIRGVANVDLKPTLAVALGRATAHRLVGEGSALVLGQARGVALAAAARAGLPVFEYQPAEVKLAFTGNGRASKDQMIRTARAVLGVSADLSDEADALALAVCHLARRVVRLAASSARAAGGRSGRAAAALSRLRPSRRVPGGAP